MKRVDNSSKNCPCLSYVSYSLYTLIAVLILIVNEFNDVLTKSDINLSPQPKNSYPKLEVEPIKNSIKSRSSSQNVKSAKIPKTEEPNNPNFYDYRNTSKPRPSYVAERNSKYALNAKSKDYKLEFWSKEKNEKNKTVDDGLKLGHILYWSRPWINYPPANFNHWWGLLKEVKF